MNLWGHVLGTEEQEIWDGNGLAKDFSDMGSEKGWRQSWVRVPSVFSKESLIRRLREKEVATLWDYPPTPGQKRSAQKGGGRHIKQLVKNPPGKILRAALFPVLEELRRRLDPGDEPVHFDSKRKTLGKTDDKVGLLEGEVRKGDLKAARADNAPVDLDIWAIPGETVAMKLAREILWRFCLRWWCWRLRREADRWIRHHGNLRVDRLAAADCIRRAELSSWFGWEDRSRLFFWEWGEWAQDARDGVPFWHHSDPKPWFGHNFTGDDPADEVKLREKEDKLILRWYLERGYVSMVVTRFGVKKPGDVRCIWDSKQNGHNATLWAPSFPMPTFQNLTNLVIKKLWVTLEEYLEGMEPDMFAEPIRSFQEDMDIGEMFLNYTLHYRKRHACGVRITRPFKDGDQILERESFLCFT